MKKIKFFLVFCFIGTLAIAQHDICYEGETSYTAEYPALTFNGNTNCWEIFKYICFKYRSEI